MHHHRANAIGRSRGRTFSRRVEKLDTPPHPFTWLSKGMLESAVRNVASDRAKNMLFGILLERRRHGGAENGPKSRAIGRRTVITIDDLNRWLAALPCSGSGAPSNATLTRAIRIPVMRHAANTLGAIADDSQGVRERPFLSCRAYPVVW